MTVSKYIFGLTVLVLLLPQAWSSLIDIREQNAAKNQSAKFAQIGQSALKDGALGEAVLAYQQAVDLNTDDEQLQIKLALAQCRFTAERPEYRPGLGLLNLSYGLRPLA